MLSYQHKGDSGMDIDPILTAVSDNGPLCNVYTLMETHTFKFADVLTEQQIKERLAQHTVKLRDTGPCSQRRPTLIPLDGHLADCRDRDMFGGRWRRASCSGPASSPSN